MLIQGWRLTYDNVEHFLDLVNDRLVNIISLIASITAKAIEQREMNPRGEDLLNASSNVITMTTPVRTEWFKQFSLPNSNASLSLSLSLSLSRTSAW